MLTPQTEQGSFTLCTDNSHYSYWLIYTFHLGSYLVIKLYILNPLSAAPLLWLYVWSPPEIVIFLLLKDFILSKPGAQMTLYKALGFGLVVRTLSVSCYNLMKIEFQFAIKTFTWSLSILVIKWCVCGNRNKAFLEMLYEEIGLEVFEIL